MHATHHGCLAAGRHRAVQGTLRVRVGHAFAKPKAFADVVRNAGSTLYICFRPVAVALAAAAAPPS